MKITYEFVTGEVSEVEVEERLGGMLLDLDRQQYNNDKKETHRHVSFDGMDYEGEQFASAKDTEGEGCAGRKWRGCIPLWRYYPRPAGTGEKSLF